MALPEQGEQVEAETLAKPRGRPRSERCHAAVLEATVALLEERHYAEVSIEAIAERAGVGKATIYKWWPGKALLAMEAYTARANEQIPAPDTGSVERDVRLLLRRTCRVLSQKQFGDTVAGLIAEAQSDRTLAEPFRVTFIGSRRAGMATILARGIARGELRNGFDVEATVDLLYGPLWYRLLLRHAPLSEPFADRIVTSVLASLMASEAAPPPVSPSPKTRRRTPRIGGRI